MSVIRPTFYRICKKKSTESFQSIPYAVAVFRATLWLYYAVLIRDVLMLTINTAALFIETVYLGIYLTYAPKKARVLSLSLTHTHSHIHTQRSYDYSICISDVVHTHLLKFILYIYVMIFIFRFRFTKF